jgi:hypothetical protein
MIDSGEQLIGIVSKPPGDDFRLFFSRRFHRPLCPRPSSKSSFFRANLRRALAFFCLRERIGCITKYLLTHNKSYSTEYGRKAPRRAQVGKSFFDFIHHCSLFGAPGSGVRFVRCLTYDFLRASLACDYNDHVSSFLLLASSLGPIVC